MLLKLSGKRGVRRRVNNGALLQNIGSKQCNYFKTQGPAAFKVQAYGFQSVFVFN